LRDFNAGILSFSAINFLVKVAAVKT